MTASVFKKHLKIDAVILKDSRINHLSGLLSCLLLAYLTSLALARYYQADPFENFLQEKLKKELAKK